MKKISKKKRRLIKLERIRKNWESCSRCVLCESRNNVVLWRGNPCAKIFLIGEAPGETEDLKGKPFVGMSGKELDSMLAGCGLNSKKHVFVANVLGCRPPNNNNPEPSQVNKCKPRLERLIEIVKPKIIILLGGQASLHMAGITRVGQWKGRFTTLVTTKGFTCNAMVTYHPSYYLHRGRDKKVREEIMSHIKCVVDYINAEQE